MEYGEPSLFESVLAGIGEQPQPKRKIVEITLRTASNSVPGNRVQTNSPTVLDTPLSQGSVDSPTSPSPHSKRRRPEEQEEPSPPRHLGLAFAAVAESEAGASQYGSDADASVTGSEDGSQYGGSEDGGSEDGSLYHGSEADAFETGSEADPEADPSDYDGSEYSVASYVARPPDPRRVLANLALNLEALGRRHFPADELRLFFHCIQHMTGVTQEIVGYLDTYVWQIVFYLEREERDLDVASIYENVCNFIKYLQVMINKIGGQNSNSSQTTVRAFLEYVPKLAEILTVVKEIEQNLAPLEAERKAAAERQAADLIARAAEKRRQAAELLAAAAELEKQAVLLRA